MKNILKYLRLLRINQYVKNLFIFLPLFFSQNILDNSLFFKTFIGFILFCLISSSVYIFNDLKDFEEDKVHPVKKHRPIVSGEISIKQAVLIEIVFFIIGIAGAILFNINFFLILLAYFVINILYSLWLKTISILDIFIVSSGFILRIFAGSAIGGIYISKWLIIMTFLLALFICLSKRRDDLLYENLKLRKCSNDYNFNFVNLSMVLMAAVIIVSYILYTTSQDVIEKFGTNDMYITSIFVVFGILRYMQVTFVEEKSGDPTKIFLTDKTLLSSVILWTIACFILIY